jgi:hypothetical protein
MGIKRLLLILFINSTIHIKNPSFFLKIVYKNKKALQQMPKGLKLSGSPYWIASEFLKGI